jgi:hypothetical protein
MTRQIGHARLIENLLTFILSRLMVARLRDLRGPAGDPAFLLSTLPART